MNDNVLKYNLLTTLEKKEVSDFIDFLFSKKKKSGKAKSSGYKSKILSVSTWSDDDLKVFEENKNLFNKWEPQAW